MGCGASTSVSPNEEVFTQAKGSGKPKSTNGHYESKSRKQTSVSKERPEENTKAESPVPAMIMNDIKPLLDEFVQAALDHHNVLRAKHGAPPLTANLGLIEYSQTWADDIAARDKMQHSNCTLPGGGRVGENIYMCWSSDGSAKPSGKDATQSWYDEIKDYNYDKPGFAMNTGHFTQVVWKGSNELGIAWARSPKGSVYIVATYRPAGNMQGSFPQNVLKSTQSNQTVLPKPANEQNQTKTPVPANVAKQEILEHEKPKSPVPNALSVSNDVLQDLNEFVKDALDHHNVLRAKHGAPPLTAAPTLIEYSQKWADDIASRDKMQHSNCTLPSGGRVGENIYMCWSSDGSTKPSGRDATQSWYDEIKDYNYDKPGFAMNTGHFTQVVWKGSSEFGIAWARSANGSIYIVANYSPPGNFQGAFKQNVLPKS